jgi:hypothetical protein
MHMPPPNFPFEVLPGLTGTGQGSKLLVGEGLKFPLGVDRECSASTTPIRKYIKSVINKREQGRLPTTAPPTNQTQG